MAVRGVVFDSYKTLIDIDSDEESPDAYRFLVRWLSYCGITIDAPALRLRYLELCRQEMSKMNGPFPDFDIGKVFSGLLSGSALPEVEKEAKSREMALLFRMLTTRSISVYPGVHELLSRLKGRAKLGIVSNAQRLFTIPELCKFDLIDYFDAIVLSSDAGIRKPDPKLFHRLLEAISVNPDEAIFVGDNIFDDVYGASTVGMKTVWLNREGKPADTCAAQPDYEIRRGSYEELTRILESTLDSRDR